MIISTSKTNSFLSGAYKEHFAKYLYQDFSEMFNVDTFYLPNPSLLNLFEQGFKPVVSNIFEKLRFVWMECYTDSENTINDLRWCDIDYLVLYVVRPWYQEIIEILHDEANRYLN